ncbi:hypothetical protein O6H91_08G056000 [Diphasiastrum complanatum]|uniref:Uncharacterized protein n=2 Tax=Diphasiastrum complanatum TaxID=34168 RepID=A0ACC2CYT5_DIPCM|nr:hypothetical protein O6H91_08G056000 [Diphasiastrum complanatum]KAJ7546827.1 hypothetical protein O6H91_08G056000 [Diphasiastrum complanatum]
MYELGRVKSQTMEGRNKKFVRFHSDNNSWERSIATDSDNFSNLSFGSVNIRSDPSSSKHKRPFGSHNFVRLGKYLQYGASKVFPDDEKRSERPSRAKILDPRSKFVQKWNQFFVISCLAAVFIDPLFFYLPVVNGRDVCISIQENLEIIVTVLRTITDSFYLFHMTLQFRTAFVAPSSQVFGRGELVVDYLQIARRYLKKDFWLDLIAVLPLPQFFIWVVIPIMKGTTADNTKNALRLIVLVQYLPRLYRIFPLTSQMVKTTGVVTETAWAGAAYNLLLYMLASHVLGACWYLLAVERQDTCWRKNCKTENGCKVNFFDCGSQDGGQSLDRKNWLKSSKVTANCSPGDNTNGGFFNFGIYADALTNEITSDTNFIVKYFYCLWWGLRNLSTLGQGLTTSSYMGEVLFSIALAILGLILFALLIGNMQAYLQSLTVRLEEMRLNRRDTEQWMSHRQLPPDLRDRVRRYEQYKWVATRGVDEELLVQGLPADLRREIKRHLCLDLVKRVPIFGQMDGRLLDAMCEPLKPVLYTEGTYIVREGDPVNEMLFIIRGNLESVTTDGGRTGFLNSGYLGPGDFCGEELLTWALHPKPSRNLPSSTRTVKALVEVEAFALRAEDLKFVAGQFRRLHSKQLQQTFRLYSHQWRTWAALYIQAAWRRYQRRRLAELRRKAEDHNLQEAMSAGDRTIAPSLGTTLLASRFIVNAMRGLHRTRSLASSEAPVTISKLSKPEEPDFSVEEDE